MVQELPTLFQQSKDIRNTSLEPQSILQLPHLMEVLLALIKQLNISGFKTMHIAMDSLSRILEEMDHMCMSHGTGAS